jgi:hypothetical protein
VFHKQFATIATLNGIPHTSLTVMEMEEFARRDSKALKTVRNRYFAATLPDLLQNCLNRDSAASLMVAAKSYS